jgi:DNA-binding transcriptional MerR regulator
MAMREQRPFPDGEVYTIGQVSDATGVPVDTIRSWERRHGFPVPQRTPSGQRRYTATDVALVAEIQELRREGRTMDQVLRRARALQRAAPPDPVGADEAVVPILPRQRLAAALTSADLARAEKVLATAAWSLGAAAACLDVLYPAWSALSEEAVAGNVSPPLARVATAWVTRKLDAWLDLAAHGPCNILVAAMHDDSSGIHGLALSAALAVAGLTPAWAGSGHAPQDLPVLVEAFAPQVVVLVAASPASVTAASATVARLRRDHPKITVFLAGTDAAPDGIAGILPLEARAAAAWIRDRLPRDCDR